MLSLRTPWTVVSGLKELVPALDTASSLLFLSILLASCTLSCVMVCFSHRCDRFFFTWFCSRPLPGCWVMAQEKIHTLLLPLLTTTRVGGGPVECPPLARNWSSDQKAHCCWEYALVSLGHKRREGGMTVSSNLVHNGSPASTNPSSMGSFLYS